MVLIVRYLFSLCCGAVHMLIFHIKGQQLGFSIQVEVKYLVTLSRRSDMITLQSFYAIFGYRTAMRKARFRSS